MSITIPTVKVLWSRAHNQCAFPRCTQALTAESIDATTGEIRTNPVGQQAHIRSYRPDGPRYDPAYPADKLHSYQNLILLCPTHHARVDANGGAEFTVEALVAMREEHEKQLERRDSIETAVRLYTAQQYEADDRVLFEQVDLVGPSVDAMFVDVPFACRPDVGPAELMLRIAQESPGDVSSVDTASGNIVTGAAQALPHPSWKGNALLVGGPGQGKSTLLQYVCQFYRARLLGRDEYTGRDQQLGHLTDVKRLPIRLDLRNYADWAGRNTRPGKRDKAKAKSKVPKKDARRWPTIEEYIVDHIVRFSGGRAFSIEDLSMLVSNTPILLAFDGLDEVANLTSREEVSSQIVDTQVRLVADAVDLVVLVATRPGGATAALWSSARFPRFSLRRLTHGLRLQYLQRWAKVAKLTDASAEKLQRTFMENQNVPHIHELASYPMQLAILLHLLHRRQLLPQRRTELYSEYFKTFLDREQSEDKEPLLAEERQVIEDIHAYIAWHIHTQMEEGKSSGSIKRSELRRLLRDHLNGREDGPELAEALFSAFTTRVLCLAERDPGSGFFQFDVQSLREYFVAVYIFDETDRAARDECLVALLKRPYWSNACRFMVGMYSKGEIRGMRSVLEDLSADRYLGLHPLLRSTAVLFLNDRSYEGQKDGPIQEIVDFVLDGPGLVLAEDGLLETVGSGLQLSERAGRVQAVRNLKQRLETESEPEIRSAAAASLRRHAAADDDVASWWWERYKPTQDWLETASRLGVFHGINSNREDKLFQSMDASASESTWPTMLLAEGGYGGVDERLLQLVKRDINEGAVEVFDGVDSLSSVGRILVGAEAAMLRRGRSGSIGAASTARTRLRGKEPASFLSRVVDGTAELRKLTAAVSDSEWQQRLVLISELWGRGWVLNQAVATLPSSVVLDTMAAVVRPTHVDLHDALLAEADARGRRGDVQWWRDRIREALISSSLPQCVFAVLTHAAPATVIALADDISTAVDNLTPKTFVAIRRAVGAFTRSAPTGRQLVIHDALRLKQAVFSPKTLWLMREASTEASVRWIDTRLSAPFDELLRARIGDLRELVRIFGSDKSIKFEAFRSLRSSLPAGGWASNIKIGSLRTGAAEKVLQKPHEWPSDLVQRAIEDVEIRMLAHVDSLATVAAREDWFAS